MGTCQSALNLGTCKRIVVHAFGNAVAGQLYKYTHTFLQVASDTETALNTQLQQQTDARQQAEASLADLEQKKKEGDEVLADLQQKKKDMGEALASEKKRSQTAEDGLAEANKRLLQVTRVNIKSVNVDFCYAAAVQKGLTCAIS